jgi:hypothetical protein
VLSANSCECFVHTVCRELAELSAIHCKKALCCTKLGEGGFGEVCADLMSYVELVFVALCM